MLHVHVCVCMYIYIYIHIYRVGREGGGYKGAADLIRQAYLWSRQKGGGGSTPTVDNFPPFPLYKHMPSCLGQWSATDL